MDMHTANKPFYIEGTAVPLLAAARQPAQCGAGAYLRRLHDDEALESRKGGFVLPRNLMRHDDAYTLEDTPRKGEKIGLTIWRDRSLLVWRTVRGHAHVLPIVYALQERITKTLSLYGDDTHPTQGPVLGPHRYSRSTGVPVLFPTTITDPEQRRWAARIRASLLQAAWTAFSTYTTPLGVQCHPYVLERETALCAALDYDFSTQRFQRRVEKWFTHAVIAAGVREAKTATLFGAHFANGTWVEAKLDTNGFGYDSFGNPQLERQLKDRFQRLAAKNVFGCQADRYASHQGNSKRLAYLSVEPNKLSAHETLHALTWTADAS